MPGPVPPRFHTRTLPITIYHSPFMTAHLAGIFTRSRGSFPLIRRPPVGWVSRSCRLFFTNWRTFTVRDVLKLVAREPAEVHQLRSQFGLHQSPHMSLFTCRRFQLFWRSPDDPPRECNPLVPSHRTHACSRSPWVMCSLARNAASFHHTPDCNHVSWKERRYHSWSGVWCFPGIQLVRMKHQLRSCDCPNPCRLSGVSVVQHRTTISAKMITVLTRYRPIVLELI